MGERKNKNEGGRTGVFVSVREKENARKCETVKQEEVNRSGGRIVAPESEDTVGNFTPFTKASKQPKTSMWYQLPKQQDDRSFFCKSLQRVKRGEK